VGFGFFNKPTENMMISPLEVRKIRCLDGLDYSFQMLKYYYEGLWETCCDIPLNDKKVVPALASCWGFVDALHRIREISQAIPGLRDVPPSIRPLLLGKIQFAEPEIL
jgi:hypothetical protein